MSILTSLFPIQSEKQNITATLQSCINADTQKVYWFHGTGNNGKSLLINLLRKLTNVKIVKLGMELPYHDPNTTCYIIQEEENQAQYNMCVQYMKYLGKSVIVCSNHPLPANLANNDIVAHEFRVTFKDNPAGGFEKQRKIFTEEELNGEAATLFTF